MERHFDEELQEVKKNILKMVSLVENAVQKAAKSLQQKDTEVAEDVISEDEVIDMLEIEIDRQCLELIAKRQPMANDLRFITSIMKINSDLERIGDLAINVANRGISLSKLVNIKSSNNIVKMADQALLMLKDVMKAFIDGDTKLAREICGRDPEIDEMYVKNFREVLTYMMEDNKNIKAGIHCILAAKQVERMADHVTNIAEDIVYMVEGKTIKHKMEEKEPENE